MMNNLFGFEETEQYGIRKGIVFYFKDWIDEEIILTLENIIEQFLVMTHEEFTKKRGGDEYVNRRNIRGGWHKVFHREFDGKDFSNSNILILDNCSTEHLQTVQAVLTLCNFRPPLDQYPYLSHYANELYFQLPIETEWDDIYHFIETVNSLLDLHYASSGYEMASNILYYPGSAGRSTRALKDLKYVNSEYAEWASAGQISGNTGIPCPNFIQVLCSNLQKRIQWKPTTAIHQKLAQDKMILDILDRSSEHMYEPTFDELEVRYDRLYQLLKPIIIFPKRPLYMKKEDWDKRLKRFEKISL